MYCSGKHLLLLLFLRPTLSWTCSLLTASSRWTTPCTGRTLRKRVSMSVWMGKTARASSAASRSVKEARGGEEESTLIYWSWTCTRASFSPPPSCCLTSSTGWATSTFSTVLDLATEEGWTSSRNQIKNSNMQSYAEGGRRTKKKLHPTSQTGGRLLI